MKTFSNFSFKHSAASLALLLVFAAGVFAQTPQYYNTTGGASSNVFPFSQAGGKEVQWMLLSGTLNQPSPCPSGNITALYFYMSGTGSGTFNTLYIKMGLTTLTTFPTGQIYTGQLDTVYYHTSVTLNSTINSWMMITLDTPFPYDNTKTLVVDVSNCGMSLSGSMAVHQSSGSGVLRNYINHSGSCNFVYSGQDASIINFGVDVAAPPSTHQPHQWCSNYPPLPGSGAIFGHASVALNDTLYVAGGDPSGLPTTNVYRYSIIGNNWSTGVPLNHPKTGGDLVAAGGKLYYIGGGGAAISTGDSYTMVYDPLTGHWSDLANIPTPVTGNVAEEYNDSLIYCMMGGWTSYLTTIQVYRINSNTWTTATAFSGGPGRRSFAGGLTGDTIFIACGYNGTYLNGFAKGIINPANPLSITWTALPNTIWTASRAGGTAIDGKFYLFPGDTGTGAASSGVGIYNAATATWTYVYGDPNISSNYWGVISASYVTCNGIDGIRIWKPGGALTLSQRLLSVFADTCLTGCTLTRVSNHNPKVPDKFSLLQNYPNPFNPATTISYAIPRAGNVKIILYDILGREVATLINEFQQPGNHIINYNASALASGVYIYRMESGSFIDSKKMVLIK